MPIRKPVARRRLRSVIQDLMYMAARLDLPLPSLGLVVLAEQSLAWDLGKAVPTVYSPGVPGYLLSGKENDATVRVQWLGTPEILYP